MNFKDYLYIILKSALLTTIISPLIIAFMYIIDFNFTFSAYICRISGIPKDLCLTVMSAGFQNNIIILLFVIEFILICYIIDIISKTKLFYNLNEIFEYI